MKPGLRDFLVCLLLVFLSLFLHLWRLSVPEKEVFDEVYYVGAAQKLSRGTPDPNWVHPPLMKLFMAGSLRLFGNKPMAWRLPSVFCSALAAVFFYLLAQDLLGGPGAALLASLLYLLDGITFVHSRLGMLDMGMVAFLLGSFYFFRKERLLLCSVFLGLSVACKWGGVLTLPILVLVSLCKSKAWKTRQWAFFAISLLLPALCVYVLVYQAGTYTMSPGRFLSEHKQMLLFHLRPAMEHPYKAPWWEWLLLIRPIWYAYREEGGFVSGILALPNPFLWWPAVLAVLFLFLRYRDETARFISLASIFFVVPWAASLKGGFIYYLLPAAPFLVLGLTYWIRFRPWIASLVLGLALFGFVWFYPLYAAVPILKGAFYRRLWLPGWV